MQFKKLMSPMLLTENSLVDIYKNIKNRDFFFAILQYESI